MRKGRPMLKEQLKREKSKIGHIKTYTFMNVILDMMLILVGIIVVYILILSYIQKENKDVISALAVIGIVKWHIPYVGGILSFITTNILISFSIGLLIIVCLLFLRNFLKKRREIEELKEIEEPEEQTKESIEILKTEQLEIHTHINKVETMPFNLEKESQKNGLTIEKNIGGEMVNPLKKFDFTVTFEDGGNYSCTKSNSQKQKLLENKGTIRLKHGEAITIQGLPIGLNYTIEEANYSKEGYFASVESVSGAISNQENRLRFTNYEESQSAIGKLSVTKRVLEKGINPDKEYLFAISFSDGNPYDYSINGSAGGTVGGSKIVLIKAEETAEFAELPEGITYAVSEIDYESEYCSANAPNIRGKIVGNNKIQIAVINKNLDISILEEETLEEETLEEIELQEEIEISVVQEIKDNPAIEEAEKQITYKTMQNSTTTTNNKVEKKKMQTTKKVTLEKFVENTEFRKRVLIAGACILIVVTVFHRNKK